MPSPDTLDFLKRIRRDWAQVRPDLDASPMLLLVTLSRLHTALSRQIERTYLSEGVNPAGWDLLVTLYRSAPPTGLTPKQLTELTAITGPSMTNRIGRLLAKGLIEQQASPDDRRSFRVRLTPAGRALVERLLPAHIRNERRILAALTPEETQNLERLALKLLTHLEALDPEASTS